MSGNLNAGSRTQNPERTSPDGEEMVGKGHVEGSNARLTPTAAIALNLCTKSASSPPNYDTEVMNVLSSANSVSYRSSRSRAGAECRR
jgi:hypothetical protein